ncbi:hypothetical protein SynBIOSE41_01256 [Synechococcus sp. BIOS-E4-1]|nr:hypothetical protein SynBIOSE41_01256 [Synechococcus sp. BIOS-E4-1]
MGSLTRLVNATYGALTLKLLIWYPCIPIRNDRSLVDRSGSRDRKDRDQELSQCL